jgi:hypothetical protein
VKHLSNGEGSRGRTYEVRHTAWLKREAGPVECAIRYDGTAVEESRMAEDAQVDGRTTRRGFLKRAALAGAAASALGLLSRQPFGKGKSGDRSIPADIPGAGSIFQPRNDGRRP